MLTKTIVVAVFALALGVSASVAAGDADEFKPVRGTWIAKPGVRSGITITRLRIKPDGMCDWAAEVNDARAEGSGQLKKDGAHYVLTVEFQPNVPRRYTITKQGIVLKLTDANDRTIEFTASDD